MKIVFTYEASSYASLLELKKVFTQEKGQATGYRLRRGSENQYQPD